MKKTVIEWRKATEEEILNGSPEMIMVRQYETDEDVDPILVEKLKYDQRVVDGPNAFLMLLSELVVFSRQNNLPREINRDIETRLEFVKSQVIDGQWISAREKLAEVVIGGYLTQELYDRIKNSIDDYILKNY